MIRLLIDKQKRLLTVYADQRALLQCGIALGSDPVGHKRRIGDGKTPEGVYYICLKRKTGKYGPALGISYPSLSDARQAAADGRLEPGIASAF